jgi:hypothetical protein
MRKFDYRAPRFAVDFPVRLNFEDSVQQARCREISTEGMKLEVRQPLAPASCGVVVISYQDFALEVPIRVAHSGAFYDGVQFVYSMDEQRDEVNRLVARLSAPQQQRSKPILIR